MKDIIINCLEMNIYFMVVFFCYQIGFRKSTDYHLSRIFLLLGISISILLPFIEFDHLFSKENSVLVPILLEQVEIGLHDSIQESSFSFIGISVLIYFIISIMLLLKIAGGLLRVFQIRRNTTSTQNYLLVPDSHEAFSFFHWIFIGELIPKDEKDSIYQHELVHSKKLHSVDIVLCQLLVVLFWINPFVHLLQKRLKELHEFEADDQSCTDTNSYIELLLKQQLSIYNISFIHSFNSNHLKTRIMKINQKPIKVRLSTIMASLFALCITFLMNQNINSMSKADPNNALKQIIKLEGLSKLSSLSNLSLQNKGGEVEKQASFPGGNEALMQFIMKNLKYPKEAKEAKKEGTVFIQFKVGTDGSCSDYKVLKAIDPSLEASAMEVLKKMPKWEPAIKEGKKVASVMTLPFKFTLNPPPPPAPPAE